MKKVSIAYDNFSKNTGDIAIGIGLKQIFLEHSIECNELFFNRYDKPQETIVVGGGHLIRDCKDCEYDRFKLKGKHILNAVGILNKPHDLYYLEDYKYVSVRTEKDKEILSYIKKDIHVVPCTTAVLRSAKTIDLQKKRPAIGIHFLPYSFSKEEDAIFIQWANGLIKEGYDLFFIPITLYNYDYVYMSNLSDQIPGSVMLPPFEPLEIHDVIRQFDYFISSSLHGAIFAMSQNVPFILREADTKMFNYLKDRSLERYLFNNMAEVITLFNSMVTHKPDYSHIIATDISKLNEHIYNIKQVI